MKSQYAKRKICGYARYSSENQKEDSIEVQKRTIAEYAKSQGLKVDYYYEDKAISGTTVNRPGYQKMISDIENDEIALVLFSAVDRMGRNHLNDMDFLRIADAHKTELRFIDDDLSTIGDQLSVIKASYEAHLESDKIGIRIRKKAAYAVSLGAYPGGRVAIGYKCVINPQGKRKLAIDKDKALIVMNIFNMFLKHNTIGQIVKECNRNQWKTSNNKDFCKDSITGILRNDVYIGNLSYGKAAGKNLSGQRNSREKNLTQNVVIYEDAHAPIIDKEDWEKVQSMLDGHTNNVTSHKHFYLLRKVMRCRVCNQGMSGEQERSHDAQYSIYKCNNESNHRACLNSRKKVKAEIVESVVCDHIAEHLLHPTMLQLLTELMNKYYEANAKLDENMRIKRSKLDDCKKEKKVLVELSIRLGDVDEDIVKEIKHCNESIKKLEAEIALLDQQMQTPSVNTDDVREQLQNLHKVMLNPNILSSLKLEVVQTFVDKIELDGDSFEIFYKNLPVIN